MGKALAQQLDTKVIVTPITNKICTLGHLVTPGTDICTLIHEDALGNSLVGKGKGEEEVYGGCGKKS